MEEYKTCSRCKQVLSVNLFGKDKHKKDGLRHCCKKCRSVETKVSYDRRAEYWVTYRQNNAEKLLDYKRAYKSKNETRIKLQDIEYRAANRDKIANRQKEHRLANPEMYANYSQIRRALKNGAKFFVCANDIKKIMRNSCFYCGAPSEHLDHVVALSRGGNHSIGNLIASCSRCNTSKGAKTIMEWRLWKMRLGLVL